MDHIAASHDNTDYPRPTGPVLTPAELRPADILLSRGTSEISNQIVAVDRGSYSHCALWSGSGIIEATLKGGIEEHSPNGERDVYRYRELNEESSARIVANARLQVEGKYAVAEIHLLAVVFQKWWPFGRPRRSAADAILGAFGGKKADQLRAWLQSKYAEQAPRVCSELVALAYFEAECAILVHAFDQRPALALASTTAPAAKAPDVDPKTARPNAASLGSDDISELQRELTRALRDANAALAAQDGALEGLLVGDVALDAETREPIGVVTPGDLQFSPSLEFCGTLRAG